MVGNRGCHVLWAKEESNCAACNQCTVEKSVPLMVRGQISAHSMSVRAPLMLNNINRLCFAYFFLCL